MVSGQCISRPQSSRQSRHIVWSNQTRYPLFGHFGSSCWWISRNLHLPWVWWKSGVVLHQSRDYQTFRPLSFHGKSLGGFSTRLKNMQQFRNAEMDICKRWFLAAPFNLWCLYWLQWRVQELINCWGVSTYQLSKVVILYLFVIKLIAFRSFLINIAWKWSPRWVDANKRV